MSERPEDAEARARSPTHRMKSRSDDRVVSSGRSEAQAGERSDDRVVSPVAAKRRPGKGATTVWSFTESYSITFRARFPDVRAI